ncbi:hypothetical protein HPB50_004919 [Hyalomma asiaticum]|uniref:Uncharacterized protein n=1 Tax=Hyalomma asiaticum TaxID=266040 RepID=A0ACB7RY06_HYAAI|nr:hypothetical protein HPB50_004919 [Hyalomma asiaticum]
MKSAAGDGATEAENGDVPDAFEIYRHLGDVFAVSDVNDDGVFECTEAVLTDYQTEPKTATYLFLFKGPHGTQKKNVSFHVSPSTSPDKITIYMDNNTEEKYEAQYLYTDYDTCTVVKGPYGGGNRCILLVARDKADDVPESCMTNFGEKCGVSVSLYNKDLCPDDE